MIVTGVFTVKKKKTFEFWWLFVGDRDGTLIVALPQQIPTLWKKPRRNSRPFKKPILVIYYFTTIHLQIAFYSHASWDLFFPVEVGELLDWGSRDVCCVLTLTFYTVLSDANKRFLYDVGVYDSDDDENVSCFRSSQHSFFIIYLYFMLIKGLIFQGMGDFLNEMTAMMSSVSFFHCFLVSVLI